MSDEIRLPAILIRTTFDDHRKRQPGGGDPKVFGDVEQVRQQLIQQCEEIKDRLWRSYENGNGNFGIAKLKYKTEAIAKSHRATKYFTDATCPVIGDQGEPGELLILVSPPMLDNLTVRIRQLSGRDANHLTGIASLELRGIERRFPEQEQSLVRSVLDRDGIASLKIRMPSFRLFSEIDRTDLENRLYEIFGQPSKPYVSFGNFALYSIDIHSMEQAMAIARMQFIERLEAMPVYFSFGTGNFDVTSITITPNTPIEELPIVAVVDKGVTLGSPLDQLIWQHRWFIPASEMDTTHGTAVAALIASGGILDGKTMTPRCRILDIGLMPKEGGVSETDFVIRLEEALQNHASEVKHWNLSLGRIPGSRSKEFSDIGQILDNFHKQFGVQFYIAAGNCEPQNYRMKWGSSKEIEDYISAPGDALCGITVGSCAPRNTPTNAVVPALAPSPYSGRGPVAYGVPKPDVSVQEGNIMANGAPIGMPTLSSDGNVRTDLVGTSFAVPIVSCVGAELFSCLSLSNLPPVYQFLVAKAMLLHHAKIPSIFGARNMHPLDYYGRGILGSMEDMLKDPIYRSTSFILAELYPDTGDLIIDNFPYPDSLQNEGRFRGKLLWTMVSEPLLDPNFKVEYARSNVDVHLEVMKKGKDGKVYPESPSKYFQPIAAYEAKLIREQHKWSPVKQLSSQQEISCTGEYWRLRATLILRDLEHARYMQNSEAAIDYRVPVVIVISIEDTTHKSNINNEMVLKWRERGYVTEEVTITTRIRARLEGHD